MRKSLKEHRVRPRWSLWNEQHVTEPDWNGRVNTKQEELIEGTGYNAFRDY